MITSRNILLVFMLLFCLSSVYAQARRFKGGDESPTVTIFLRQNTETQAVDILVSSTEHLDNTFLEVNEKKVSIQVNKSYSIATLPDNGTIRAIQENGSEVLQLAAVSVAHIIWSESASFAKAGGSLGSFGNPSGGGEYLFGTEEGDNTIGGGSRGGDDFGSVAGSGNEFDPDRKGGKEGRYSGGRGDGFGEEGSEGGGDCQTMQDSLNSLIHSINSLIRLNENMAAENKLLAYKIDRIEDAVKDSSKQKGPKETRLSTAKNGIGFSVMPNVSYSKLFGDYRSPDFKGRGEGSVSVIGGGFNLGMSFNLTKTTRGHLFLGGGVTKIHPQGAGDEWVSTNPMASLGFGLDLSDKLFVGNNFSFSWKGVRSMDMKAMLGFRKGNAVFGGSIGFLLTNANLYLRLLDTVSLGTFIIVEFGGK